MERVDRGIVLPAKVATSTEPKKIQDLARELVEDEAGVAVESDSDSNEGIRVKQRNTWESPK